MLKTIKTKVIITYSLVMIAFISTLLLTTVINERSRVIELALEESTKISKMHAERLNQELSQYIAMLKILSDGPQVQSGDVARIQPRLKRLIQVGDGDFINAIYIDRNANLIDYKGNTSKATHPFYLQGHQLRGKDHYITTPLNSRFEERPVIIVAVPIFDYKSMWMGTIAVAVSIDVINEKLSSIKITQESYAWIADSEDVVVSHPNKNFIMIKLDSAVDENFVGLFDVIQKTKLQDDGYGHYLDNISNDSKIITFSKIDNLPGWNLFVTTKESDIFHDIYQVIFNVLITSFFLIIIFLLIIIKLSGKITKPLIQLTEDVLSSADNKHFHFKNIQSNDEIGQLHNAFREAIRKNHQHTHYLEEMVNDRTKEITEKNLILSEQNNQLEKIASTDSLTKLFNRRAFNELVDTEMSHAKNRDFPAILVVLDIDHFKTVNDQFGHDVGDDILCRLAADLSAYSGNNLICRWGGEEFVILLSNTAPDIAATNIEALRQKTSRTHFDPVGGLTFSAGMAIAQPEEPFKEWFQRADKALFKAKTLGRNRVEWA